MYNQVYATYQQLKSYMLVDIENKYLTDDDTRLKRFAVQASADFAGLTAREFMPYRATRFYSLCDIVGYSLPSLLVKKDLLEVFELKTNNLTTTLTDFELKHVDSYNVMPYDRIELNTISGESFTQTNPQKSQSVDALWSYHNDPDNMWRLLDTVQDNPLAIGATTINVTNADQFLIQGLLRLGTTNSGEFAFITAKNVDTNTLTVERGANGTTAVEQVLNTNIYQFVPMQDVNFAATVLGVYNFNRKDNLGGETDRRLISADGAIFLPSTLPQEVKSTFIRYRKLTY